MTALVSLTVSAAAGLWLMFAPAVLGYGGVAADNDRIVGPVAVSIALVAMSEVVRAVRFVNVALGGWLLVAAFVLPYGSRGTVSALVTAVVLAASSIPGGRRSRSYGGGWRTLWRSSTS